MLWETTVAKHLSKQAKPSKEYSSLKMCDSSVKERKQSSINWLDNTYAEWPNF